MATNDEITGGELLVRCLAAEGVKLLFGLPCPEIEPILASLEPNGLRFVPVRHEAAAVHMAEGVYKTTGNVAAVVGNPGPGTANLLPGVVTALAHPVNPGRWARFLVASRLTRPQPRRPWLRHGVPL